MLKKIKNALIVPMSILSLTAASLGVTLPHAISVQADTLDDLNNQKNNLENEKQNIETQVNDLTTQITNTKEEIKKLEQQALEKGDQIFETNKKLEAQKQKEQKQYEAMSKRIQFMYESEDMGTYETLITSSDMADALNKVQEINTVYEYDRKQLDALTKTKNEIDKLKTQYEEELKEIERIAKESEEKQKQLEDNYNALKEKVKNLDVELSDVNKKIYNETQAQLAAKRAADEAHARQEKARLEAMAAAAKTSSIQYETNSAGVYNITPSKSPASVTYSDTNATQAQKTVAYNARVGNSTHPAAYMWCAAWVSGVYNYSGITQPRGDAIEYWYKWGYTGGTDMYNVPLGAAVVSNPTAANGYYGHIGIYIGDGMVSSNLGYVCIESIESFSSRGGFTGWVWPNGVDLTKLP